MTKWRRIKHPRRAELHGTRKLRVSKMKCERVTRKNSNYPPFNANTCPGMLKKGKNRMYVSSETKNGIFKWKLYTSIQTREAA
jgi:hypothetical protein